MLSESLVGFYDRLKLCYETWASTTAYSLGDIVKPLTYNSHAYQVTTAGTTGGTEPTWSSTEGNTLSSGTVFFTVKGTKVYNTIAPQTDTPPYVTFGLLTESPIGDFADFESVENQTYYVNCFSSKSIADLMEISDEVMAALDDATVSVTGYTSMKVVREFISSPMYDLETGVFQTSLRYRVWLDKT